MRPIYFICSINITWPIFFLWSIFIFKKIYFIRSIKFICHGHRVEIFRDRHDRSWRSCKIFASCVIFFLQKITRFLAQDVKRRFFSQDCKTNFTPLSKWSQKSVASASYILNLAIQQLKSFNTIRKWATERKGT